MIVTTVGNPFLCLPHVFALGRNPAAPEANRNFAKEARLGCKAQILFGLGNYTGNPLTLLSDTSGSKYSVTTQWGMAQHRGCSGGYISLWSPSTSAKLVSKGQQSLGIPHKAQ